MPTASTTLSRGKTDSIAVFYEGGQLLFYEGSAPTEGSPHNHTPPLSQGRVAEGRERFVVI